MFETVDSIQKYRLQCYNSSSQNCCQVFFLKNNIFYVIFFNTAMKLTLQSSFDGLLFGNVPNFVKLKYKFAKT